MRAVRGSGGKRRSQRQSHRTAPGNFVISAAHDDPAVHTGSRANKSVVRRDVVRLVTPGTLTEDTLLDARTNNYLLAIARARGSSGADRIGLAWIDISTAEFMVTECSVGELAATLARINPNEAIVTDALYSDADLGPLLRELPAVTPLTRDVFDGATAARRLCDYVAGAAARRAAHRCCRDRAAAGCDLGLRYRRRRARRYPQRTAQRARHVARAGAAVGRTWRPARPGGIARRHFGRGFRAGAACRA